MKRRILAATLVLVMAASLFAGCGKKESGSDGDKIKLTFLDKHPEMSTKAILNRRLQILKRLIRI